MDSLAKGSEALDDLSILRKHIESYYANLEEERNKNAHNSLTKSEEGFRETILSNAQHTATPESTTSDSRTVRTYLNVLI
jgi:hypothetical protein